MPIPILRLLVLFLLLAAGPALAREIADAPKARAIGFSEDGRYFAYEQYLDDSVSDSVLASIDVLDRQTGRSADGFPLGFLGMSKDGTYPVKVGDHAIAPNTEQDDGKRLATLRRLVREAASPKLEALGIRHESRRLAGQPLTDRSRPAGPVAFTVDATVPGAVPDQQPVYRLSARIAPKDAATCIATKTKPRDHAVEVEIARQDQQPPRKMLRSTVSIPWTHGDEECAQAAIVTDVLVPETVPAEGASHAVVLVLAVSWAPHAEASRYLAGFVPLP